jgi:hypothetical protein
MSLHGFARPLRTRLSWSVLTAFALTGFLLAEANQAAKGGSSAAAQGKSGENHYIGAEKCKNCHQAEASGNQFAAWQKMEHAKAYATLASDKAKEIGKLKGIDDPQKSDACLKCHVTAFGLAADLVKKGFDPKAGVQCESCHGPGEQHFKARFSAASKGGGDEGFGDDKSKAAPLQKIPEGEIVSLPDQKTCLVCHNDQSPTFKPFCFQERLAKVLHDDPRKPHTDRKVCACEKCACVHGSDDKCAAAPKEKK